MKNEEKYIFQFHGMPVELCAFYNYPRANNAQRDAVCNGAGPRRFGWLIPDTFVGLCITEAANNHDWDFQWGETIEDFNQANRTFKNNMLRLAEALRLKEYREGGWGWFGKMYREKKHRDRLEMIEGYYKAVDSLGGPSFWDKENVGFKWTDIA